MRRMAVFGGAGGGGSYRRGGGRDRLSSQRKCIAGRGKSLQKMIPTA